MKNNFDLKKFLLENKLTAPSEMHEVTSEKVQEVYDKLIDTINRIAKELSDDEAYELHEKLKKFFNGGIMNEEDLEQHPIGGPKAGLTVTGRGVEDNTKIGQMIRDEGLRAQWNAREGYWFFPEDGDMLNTLERKLNDGFDEYGIDADIESI